MLVCLELFAGLGMTQCPVVCRTHLVRQSNRSLGRC